MNVITQGLNGFEKNYMYFNVGIHAVFFLVFLGVIYVNTAFLRELNILIQISVCLFLMIRFHPFRRHEFHCYDAGIIFSCALFLLVNLGIVESIKQYLPTLQKEIKL